MRLYISLNQDEIRERLFTERLRSDPDTKTNEFVPAVTDDAFDSVVTAVAASL